ncbi:hypothetical protein AT239_03830 [Bartonella henselae]|nr:hypothetical protein AT239_03830 [Bartonella henselae]OLL53393.1 hypothetical protein AT240_02860 [Bartonella henselae]
MLTTLACIFIIAIVFFIVIVKLLVIRHSFSPKQRYKYVFYPKKCARKLFSHMFVIEQQQKNKILQQKSECFVGFSTDLPFE